MLDCRRALVALIALSASTFSPVLARTWYIRPDGTGDAPTIQAGVDSARAGDEVLLAPGEYTSASEGSTGPTMIQLKPGIVLRGEGGASATSLVSTNRAIRLAETGDGTRIEGLTIRGTASIFNPEPNGGGLYILGNGSPVIADCVFTNCFSADGFGGGIACEPGVQPTISGCSFFACRSRSNSGGAVSCGVATIIGCEFRGNISYYGGGAVVCGSATIENCEFKDNGSGGDPGGTGGAIAGSGVRVIGCTFENNSSGGPFVGSGGAVAGAVYVTDCVFANNRSDCGPGADGGALRLADGGVVIRCTFAGNQAQFGGAISMSSGRVTECLFIGNSVSNSSSGALPPRGGAVRIYGNGVIESCTFLANSCTPATNPGAISVVSSATMERCIVVGTEGAVCEAGSMSNWRCCNLFDNSQGDTICGTDGGGNFSADPQFCAADPVASLNATLQADSPCAPDNHPNSFPCGLIGARSVGCGSVAIQARSWSNIKRLYGK